MVLFNLVNEKQRHYTDHNEEIQCMDVSEEKSLAITGQRAGKSQNTRAHIRIWDIGSLETIGILGFGEYEVGVAGVAFSTYSLKDELYVCGIDQGPENVLTVWRWEPQVKKWFNQQIFICFNSQLLEEEFL